MQTVHRDAWANPSSLHGYGLAAAEALERARQKICTALGAVSDELVVTSGATESNNLVMHHYEQALEPSEEVWLSAIEHPCVIESAQRHFGDRVRTLPVTAGGVLDLDTLRVRLTEQQPGLIAVMAANNETGVLQPWAEVHDLCLTHKVPFFCDAAQWIGKLPAKGLGECDFVSGCAHKFGGPKGVGFLKCPSQGPVRSQLVGGPQEEGRRAGTENVASVLSMMAALKERETLLAETDTQEKEAWRNAFVMSLVGAKILGQGEGRLWNTVSALLPGDCRARWVVKLDKAGFAVSTGSACASGKEAPSHVLTAMGVAADETDRVVRFSSGWETTAEDWQALTKGVHTVGRELAG